MEKYKRLFELKRYIDEAGVCFSINGDLEDKAQYIPESICSRIICIGNAYRLHYVTMIDIYGDLKLNKKQVYSLIEELLFIKSLVNDEIIDYYIPSIIKLLERITRNQNDDILWIMGN